VKVFSRNADAMLAESPLPAMAGRSPLAAMIYAAKGLQNDLPFTTHPSKVEQATTPD
jgi:hypothetical protein